MDLSRLTTRHLIFIPHSSKENYYAVDWVGQVPAEDYLYWLHHHDGIHYPVAFAFYYPLENHFNDFEAFLKEKIATGYFTEGNKLMRDFYCFENFDNSDMWIGMFNTHKKAQQNFWISEMQPEKKEVLSKQSSLFE